MNIENLAERITKYLDGRLSASEAQQFEIDLEKDPVLKKAFLKYSIAAYQPPSAQSAATRKMVEEVYQSMGTIPTPTLPWLLRLQMWFKPLTNKLMVAGLVLALLCWMFWPRVQIGQLITDNMEPAKCKGVAGETLTQRQLFERASDVYCGHEKEAATLGKLQQLSAPVDSFCMADYFIAHWFLKNGRYGEAVAAFEACLNAQKIIEANPETEESRFSLELNAILARLGAGKDVATAQDALKQLSAKVKAGTTIARKIGQLQTALPKH